MIVCIGDKIYNSEEVDIGIFLTPTDKKNIAKMNPKCDCYIQGENLVEETADRIADLLKSKAHKLAVETVKKGNDDEQLVLFEYTNHRGETRQRVVRPGQTWFGSTKYHPERQWILSAYDFEKNAYRDFAMKDIKDWKSHNNKDLPE